MESKITEDLIIKQRTNYESVADFSSSLYFYILKLRFLDPMYKFSLEFYFNVFKKAVKLAEKPYNKKVQ